MLTFLFLLVFTTGLISQVAEEIWEVKGKKIINLSKEGMTIVDYKVSLSSRLFASRSSRVVADPSFPLRSFS